MAAMATLPLTAAAIAPGEACFADEATDTATIRMLSQAERLDYGYSTHAWPHWDACSSTHHAAGTPEGDTECLRIDMQRMDCTTFVENVAAMAITISEGRSSWHDMVCNLERLPLPTGTPRRLSSRLHYISDWIIDNAPPPRHAHRRHTAHSRHTVISDQDTRLITRNREKYPARPTPHASKR